MCYFVQKTSDSKQELSEVQRTKGIKAFDKVNHLRVGSKVRLSPKQHIWLQQMIIKAIEKVGLSDPVRLSMTMREAKERVNAAECNEVSTRQISQA